MPIELFDPETAVEIVELKTTVEVDDPSSTIIEIIEEAASVISVGIQGPPGIAGAGDRHQVVEHSIPASVWTIIHNLGKMPAVEVIDSAGTVVEGNIQHLDTNTVEITFTSAFSGKALLN